MEQVDKHAICYNDSNKHIIKKLLPILKEIKKQNVLGFFTKRKCKFDNIGYHFEIKRVNRITLSKQVIGEFEIIVDTNCLEDPVIKWLDDFCNQPVINFISRGSITSKLTLKPTLIKNKVEKESIDTQYYDEQMRKRFLENYMNNSNLEPII